MLFLLSPINIRMWYSYPRESDADESDEGSGNRLKISDAGWQHRRRYPWQHVIPIDVKKAYTINLDIVKMRRVMKTKLREPYRYYIYTALVWRRIIIFWPWEGFRLHMIHMNSTLACSILQKNFDYLGNSPLDSQC